MLNLKVFIVNSFILDGKFKKRLHVSFILYTSVPYHNFVPKSLLGLNSNAIIGSYDCSFWFFELKNGNYIQSVLKTNSPICFFKVIGFEIYFIDVNGTVWGINLLSDEPMKIECNSPIVSFTFSKFYLYLVGEDGSLWDCDLKTLEVTHLTTFENVKNAFYCDSKIYILFKNGKLLTSSIVNNRQNRLNKKYVVKRTLLTSQSCNEICPFSNIIEISRLYFSLLLLLDNGNLFILDEIHKEFSLVAKNVDSVKDKWFLTYDRQLFEIHMDVSSKEFKINLVDISFNGRSIIDFVPSTLIDSELVILLSDYECGRLYRSNKYEKWGIAHGLGVTGKKSARK